MEKQRNDKEYEKFYKHIDGKYYLKVVIVSGDPNNSPSFDRTLDDLENEKFVDTPMGIAVRILPTT